MAHADETPVFLFSKPDTFTWAVRVPVPGANQYRYARFVGEFRYMELKEWRALQENQPPMSGRDLAARVLVGVHELLGEDGKTHLPATPELVERVLDWDRCVPSVIGTFEAALSGMAAEKN